MSKKADGTGVRSTIYDVAKEAKVSPATVSHVLNGTAPMSVPTQKRVFKAVRELDYRPNANARSLRAAKSWVYPGPHGPTQKSHIIRGDVSASQKSL